MGHKILSQFRDEEKKRFNGLSNEADDDDDDAAQNKQNKSS